MNQGKRGFIVALVVALTAWAGSAAQAESAIPARACTTGQGSDRAMCIAMIGAMRGMLGNAKIVCSPADPHDLSDADAVIEWIRDHPERQDESLGAITREVLQELHPCS
ncbi:MAG: hypothetical protein BroJett029_04830 [Alphaproteobacteria bacterium]|jgi:hypothetical protein|nr:MAG: hypothetical protein BroJett029_04830 [Alphaproteobacteria bacterium]